MKKLDTKAFEAALEDMKKEYKEIKVPVSLNRQVADEVRKLAAGNNRTR